MQSKPSNIFDEGQLLLINKPFEWTSFDVVNKIRHLCKAKKVGHAGTLDPLATGLLIICTGKFTKNINQYMSQEKEYTGSITLGATTPTYDLESEPRDVKSTDSITEQDIRNATAGFIGEIMQSPPAHSAIKIDGKRSYEMARKGIDVRPEARKITINEFEITSIQMPVVKFRVVCSTGTYIRSLANDFGELLGCGGYLSELCRTRIGEFLLTEALNIEQLSEKINKGYYLE